MNIEDLLTNRSYFKIPLVGNNYCGKKPSNKDVKIKLILDNENKYDHNAIKVISIRDTFKYDLGYIKKEYTRYVKSVWDKIKFKVIIKRCDNSRIYYYLIFELV